MQAYFLGRVVEDRGPQMEREVAAPVLALVAAEVVPPHPQQSGAVNLGERGEGEGRGRGEGEGGGGGRGRENEQSLANTRRDQVMWYEPALASEVIADPEWVISGHPRNNGRLK